MGETTDKSNKLAPYKPKPAFRIGAKPVGLDAARAKAAKMLPTGEKTKQEYKPGKLEDAAHKIGVVFDDSGSMAGSPIDDAHDGFEEFVKNCNPTNTALAVYPMNADSGYGSSGNIKLTTDLITVVKAVKQIKATGGTPLYETLLKMLQGEALTRGIVFSDGCPSHSHSEKEEAFRIAKEKKIPVDSVFIGGENEMYAIKLMQEIAERTGGVFIHFKPGKSNFKTAFKYLSPGLRAMLADKSFVAKVERGEVK